MRAHLKNDLGCSKGLTYELISNFSPPEIKEKIRKIKRKHIERNGTKNAIDDLDAYLYGSLWTWIRESKIAA